ncbi:MAG TPA: hypothetical protein VGP06_15795 [Janthinobacterium sp.]|nr:hypothetical protein [Janthinobacterium sp.]
MPHRSEHTYDYDPSRLLDHMTQKMQLKNDAALSRKLEVAPPVISKVRNRRLPVSASLLIRMHEVSGVEVKAMREVMGDRRGNFRLSNAQGRPKAAAQL